MRTEDGRPLQAGSREASNCQRTVAVDGFGLRPGRLFRGARRGVRNQPTAGRGRAWGGGRRVGRRASGRRLGARLRRGVGRSEAAELAGGAEVGEGLVEIAPGGLLAAEELAHDVGAGGVLVIGVGDGGGSGSSILPRMVSKSWASRRA